MKSEVEKLYERLETEARAGGYILNPNKEDAMALVEGLLKNINRYGYPSCPCRIAEGRRELDLDIICPCDYRDADLTDYGACYCALYVTKEWIEGKLEHRVVPERRPPGERRPGRALPASSAGATGEERGAPAPPASLLAVLAGDKGKAGAASSAAGAPEAPVAPSCATMDGRSTKAATGPPTPLSGRYPVWRCRVCGYLCAREKPPQVCPICRATGDRFERFS